MWFSIIAQVSHYKPYHALSSFTKNENNNLSTLTLTTNFKVFPVNFATFLRTPFFVEHLRAIDSVTEAIAVH